MKKSEKIITTICISLFIIFLLYMFISLFLIKTENFNEKEYILASLETTQTQNGDFFLGCGSINNGIKYFCYFIDNGSHIPKLIDYGKVTIYIGYKQAKVIEKRGKYFFNRSIYYDFYLPQGTIKENFFVNLSDY